MALDTDKRTIEVDEETYAAIQELKRAATEGTADPLSDELAIYMGVKLAIYINKYPYQKWEACLGLAVNETYKKKHDTKQADKE